MQMYHSLYLYIELDSRCILKRVGRLEIKLKSYIPVCITPVLVDDESSRRRGRLATLKIAYVLHAIARSRVPRIFARGEIENCACTRSIYADAHTRFYDVCRCFLSVRLHGTIYESV